MEAFTNHLDWLALLVGAVGSFLWAHNGRSARYASVWWLFSSVAWVGFAWLNGLPALGVRDALGVGSTLYGCYRWLQPPKGVAALQQPGPPGLSHGLPLSE